jgi:ribosomal protein S18 acetylase RimI-like enzyme
MLFKRVKLTPVKTDDLEKIVEFEKTQCDNKHYHYTGTLESAGEFFKDSTMYFIFYGSKNVGYVSYETNKNEAYLNSIAILPKYQNKGIGTRAVSMINKILNKQGIRDAWLVVHPENLQAVRVYEKNGFKLQKKILNYWGDGEPRLRLTKCFS